MPNQFERTALIFGEDNVEKLKSARVAVFGVGGVGGYTVEALARSGIGTLDIIDNDKVCLSNINRQIIATHKTIGQYKVDVAAERIHDINPDAIVNVYKTFYMPDTKDMFDFCNYDYVVDAIDTVTGKIQLVLQAREAGVPIISSMGAGNKINPAMFEVSDIYKTSVCPLAKVMRYELKRRGVKKLKVVYSKEKPLLEGIDLDIENGAVTSILGPNGSGKTTLLKLFLGLLEPVSGDIFVCGRNLKEIPFKERARILAYVPQKHSAVFDYKVIDVCAMGRVAYTGIFSGVGREDLRIAMECLERMEISHLADKPYTKLSGGQQQMVIIARALAQQAKILVLDEPVTGLDYGNQISLLKLLKELASEGITCIKTTHYPEHALWTSGNAIFMKNGAIIAKGPTEQVVTSENLKAIYNTDIVLMKHPENGITTCVPLV